jgi:hypothetical protein
MIRFLSKIIKFNNLYVVGIIKSDDDEKYTVLTIKKRGNKIEIVSSATYSSMASFERNTNKKLPIIIVVDGKGVLNKKIDFNNEEDLNWQKNIDYKTIYFTSLKSLNTNFISFCRKNIIDDILQHFQTKEFQVLDVYVGSFLASLLQEAIGKKELLSNDLLLSFENQKLIGFAKQAEVKKQEYSIGNDILSSKSIPLYGALVHFFVKSNEVTKTKNEKLNIDEIIYKKAFTVFGASMLIGFLLALLSSYIMIQHYSAKNAKLVLQNKYSDQSYQRILDLEKQKDNKLNIARESGFLSSKFLTYFAYEIINSIPKDISLNELNIVPVSKDIKSNLKIDFESKTMLVKGETFNESSFNFWLETIKKMDWVYRFEIISLKKDKKNKSQFEVKIAIKDV